MDSNLKCFSCGADWSEGQYSTQCDECGGGALDCPCPRCGGLCGMRWQRAVMDSHDLKIGHWYGRCGLPQEKQKPLAKTGEDESER
jgi:hypothetical protein